MQSSTRFFFVMYRKHFYACKMRTISSNVWNIGKQTNREKYETGISQILITTWQLVRQILIESPTGEFLLVSKLFECKLWFLIVILLSKILSFAFQCCESNFPIKNETECDIFSKILDKLIEKESQKYESNYSKN